MSTYTLLNVFEWEGTNYLDFKTLTHQVYLTGVFLTFNKTYLIVKKISVTQWPSYMWTNVLVDKETYFFSFQKQERTKKLKLFKRYINILSEYIETNKSCLL